MAPRRRGLLLIGGAAPPQRTLAQCAQGMELIVAADSGLDTAAAAGLLPDLVVGDMDSLVDRGLLERFAPDRILLFPRDKDETDTEIGLRVLGERGCDEVTIAGGGGGRIDHLLGIAELFERDHAPSRWLTDRADIWLVAGSRSFNGWRGSTVSVFPIGERAAQMSSEGLQWPLDGLELRRGFAGISNRAIADSVSVAVGIGKLLVIQSWVEG